jgi:hypothetical protein
MWHMNVDSHLFVSSGEKGGVVVAGGVIMFRRSS